MTTREDIYEAIRKADKAGDAESVRKLGAYLQTMPADEPPQPVKAAGNPLIDAPNAIATGFQRGLAGLVGLPVDTIANVRDLGKAAIGAPYMALTGKPVPNWLEIGDRSNDVGTGANILRSVRNAGGGFMVDPANPDYEGGYLQAAGSGAAGAMSPNQLAMGVASGLSATATRKAGGSDAAIITAAMLPTAGRQAFTEGTKRLVRGGEQGRQDMVQRVEELKRAGVDEPTLGLASGNRLIGGLENLLQSTPGAVGTMTRSRDKALAGMEGAATKAADLASTNRGAMESGRSIQAGGKAFKEDFKATQKALYDKLDQFIAGQTPVDVTNTRNTLGALNADIPGAPNLSKQFKNSRIQAIEAAVQADIDGQAARAYTPAQLKAAIESGAKDATSLNAALGEGRALPFEAVKKTRTLVGNEIADASLMSDVPRSKWNPLYGALSEDMQGAANAAGPQATNAFNRANNYTRAGVGRLERIEPVIDRVAPEQSYTALANTLKENNSTFQAVKKSLPQDARGQFAGTVIERLGRATPGQQNADGDAWSPETFLTNWSKIKPEARAELLSGIPNAGQVATLVDSVAKSASMMRDNSKMWANPSGTAANATARGIIGTVAAGGAGALAGAVNPLLPLGAAAGLGGVNLLARGVTSNRIRESMLKKTEIDPVAVNALVRAMAASGQLAQQPEK